MFSKSNTRIIFINNSVVILRQLDQYTNKCRILIDGIEKGHLVEAGGIYTPEGNLIIDGSLLMRINDLARKASAA